MTACVDIPPLALSSPEHDLLFLSPILDHGRTTHSTGPTQLVIILASPPVSPTPATLKPVMITGLQAVCLAIRSQWHCLHPS